MSFVDRLLARARSQRIERDHLVDVAAPRRSGPRAGGPAGCASRSRNSVRRRIDLPAVVDVALDQLLEASACAGWPLTERDVDDRERRLQRRVLVELVARRPSGSAPCFSSTTIRIAASRSESSRTSEMSGDAPGLRRVDDLLDEVRLDDLVGDLVDDDRARGRRRSSMCTRAAHGSRRPRPVRVAPRRCPRGPDDAAGREVRARARSPCSSVERRCRGSSISRDDRVADLARGCAAGCESPCPPRCRCEPLTSRFGNLPGRTVGSVARLVVVGLEVDGVELDVVEHLDGRPRSCAPRCIASPRADRRRSSRSCPARRRAGSAVFQSWAMRTSVG